MKPIRKSFSKETIKKMSDAKRGKNNPMYGKIGPMAGKKHSEKTKIKLSKSLKQKMRLSAIKRIERDKLNGNQLTPNYNPIACKIIDELNNYNFQHAENGGEFHIKELGYWVDGHDKDKNVVIEYYERIHYNITGSLKNKEINRENEIIKNLNCKFLRINAFDKNNLLLEKIS